jgi:hypothetical protein
VLARLRPQPGQRSFKPGNNARPSVNARAALRRAAVTRRTNSQIRNGSVMITSPPAMMLPVGAPCHGDRVIWP